MASLLPLRLICGSMFLLFTVLGTASSFPLSPLDEMKMYWMQHFCVFPSPPLYLQEKILLQQEANPVPLPVLQSCENPDGVFHKTLCSTFFNVSKVFCGYNDTSLNEHLQHDVLAKSVDDVTWDVCYYATFIGMFGFITQDPAVCKSQCEQNPQTAPVCKWLIAAVVSYTEVLAKAHTDGRVRAREQGGTAGQKQAAQTAHTTPENDSEGTRENKPNGSGTEPPTRPETLPLKNVPDANNTNEQKTTPEDVLTNDSNVTKIPVSVLTTQHPRDDDLTPVLQTGKPNPQLKNDPQPSSTTPSTPLNSKGGELQGKGGEQGGTAGQQQAAQTTHTIPENDSEGARANKPNGSGTEPPTRQETKPLKNVFDANNTNEQKTTPEDVLTNDSNVTKIPVSVLTTQHPRDDDLTPGLQTEKPKPSLENGPQPSSTTPSTPLNSKGGELQGKGDEEKSREQDQSEEHSDDDEPPSGHFMAYFITAVVLCVAGYVIYHNKKKIFAFVLEGRREGQQRRRSSAGSSSGGSSAKYHKLTPSVEEVMPSLEKSTASTNYIY